VVRSRRALEKLFVAHVQSHRILACDRRTDGQTFCNGIVRAMHTRHAVKIRRGKSDSRVQIGSRFRQHCSTVSTLDGREIRWEESINVHITSAKAFACSLANAKKSFYRAFNAVFGKVAGVASEAVTVELLKVKCLPVRYTVLRYARLVTNSSTRTR